MKTTLIIPESKARGELKVRRRSRLTWTTDHSASSYGMGVLLYSNGDLLDGSTFRALRDTLGARIETTDPDRVYGALGVPVGYPGIVKI